MGLRSEYTYLAQSLTSAAEGASGQTITFASLGASDEGNTLPTFTVVPIVEPISWESDRTVRIPRSDISTTQFKVYVSGTGSGDLPFNFDFKIISRETTAAAAGAPGTAVSWPYYCTLQDVKDRLVNVRPVNLTHGSTSKLTPNELMNLISQVYAEINAALAMGGYTVPVSNDDTTTITAGVSASDNVVTLTLDDDTIFSVGDIGLLHGQSGNNFFSEFVHVMNRDTDTDTIVVYSLNNSYDSGSTIEKVTQGFNFVRKCNAAGAAVQAMISPVTSQGRNRNEKVVDLNTWYERCLKNISDGTITLSGLDRDSNLNFIESYQTNNDDATDVVNAPIWKAETIY